MPTPAEVLQDPKFQGLPMDERRKVLTKIDPNFGKLAAPEQDRVLGSKSQIGIRPATIIESVRSRFHQLATDPIGTLSEKQFPNAQSVDTGLSDFMLGGISAAKVPGADKIGVAAKAFLAPKPTGRIARTIQALKSTASDAAEAEKMKDPAYARLVKSNEGYKPSGKVVKAKYSPNRDLEGPQGPAKAPVKVKPSDRGGVPSDPDPLADMPASDHPNRGKLKAQFMRNTPAKEPSGSRSYTAPKYGKPAQEPKPAGAPATASTPPPEGIPQEVWDAMSEEQRTKTQAGRVARDQRTSTQGPAKAPKATSKRTPEGQQQSDEIADRTLEVKSVPLAQQTVKEGVTSKDLQALSPEQRAEFMKRIGLKSSSRTVDYKGQKTDKAWHTFLGHVQTIEKLKK